MLGVLTLLAFCLKFETSDLNRFHNCIRKYNQNSFVHKNLSRVLMKGKAMMDMKFFARFALPMRKIDCGLIGNAIKFIVFIF